MGAYTEQIINAIYANGGVTLDGKTLMRSVERAQKQRGINLMPGGVMIYSNPIK